MPLLDFIRDAGEKLFHGGARRRHLNRRSRPSNPVLRGQQQVNAANAKAGDAILNYIKSQNLQATGLTVTYDGATHTAAVYGVAPDQEKQRRRSCFCCGNVARRRPCR